MLTSYTTQMSIVDFIYTIQNLHMCFTLLDSWTSIDKVMVNDKIKHIYYKLNWNRLQ